MKRVMKSIGILLLAVVVLIGVAAIALPLLVDPQDVKDQLSAQVKKHTGRDLSIPGEVEISVFPWLGATLGQVALGNAAGFDAPVFASTEKVDVRVKLAPLLLERQVEMDTVTVHGLVLNLERNAKGAANWEDLGAAPGGEAAPSGRRGGGPALAGIAIGGVDVRGGTISFTDKQAGQAVTVRNLDFRTGALTPGKPVDLELGFDLEAASPPLRGRVAGGAKVDASPDAQRVRVAGLKADAELTGDALPSGGVKATLTADVDADLGAQRVKVAGLELVTEVRGAPLADGGAKATLAADVDADLATQRVRIAGLKVNADAKGAQLPGGAVRGTASADVDLDAGKQTLAVSALKVELLDLVASGALEASGLGGKPAFAGELAVASFSPRKLLASLGQPPIRTRDPAVLGTASLRAKLSGNAGALTLKPLSVTLDETTLQGEASVANFARPALRFALALDALDLDRYLPPEQEAPAATPGAAASGAGELPAQTLRALDVAGKLSAAKLKVAKLTVSDVAASVKADDGLIRLSPISAKLYQGSYAGNIVLDVRKDKPVLSLDEKLAGVKAGPLLEDLRGEAPLTGTANVSAKLSAVGTGADAVKQTLNGDIAFQFLNGAVKGVNIGKLIRDARARLRGAAPAAGDEPLETDFAEISGTATVKNGLVSNQDLSAKSPLLRVAGKGTANLPAESLDYKVTATLVATSKGQGGKSATDLAGVPIPVHVTGTFAKPQYGLDMEALAQAVAKAKAEEVVQEQKAKVVEKVQEKVQEKLGDQAGKLLGGDKGGAGGLLKGLLGN